MAEFEPAYNETTDHESLQGFAVAGDRGGETVLGIARNSWPAWSGWSLFDAVRDRADFPQCLAENCTFMASVKAFYRREFWNVIKGDLIPEQAIASELFDTAVNCGATTAVRMLQELLNVGNREARDWEEIGEDGRIGPKIPGRPKSGQTLEALKACVKARGAKAVVKVLNQRQGDRYFEIAKRDPTQERFFWGWVLRRT